VRISAPQFRVEVRQRLVHQEGLRAPHDGAAHGDPLPLASGQLAGLGVQVRRQPERLGHLADPGVPLPPGHPGQLERKADVVVDRQVRIERVVLEDHGDVARGLGYLVDRATVQQNPSFRDGLQAADHPQDRGLAAAGGPHQDDQLAVGHREADVPDGDQARGIRLAHALQAQFSHR
jgi:hypothetical protein